MKRFLLFYGDVYYASGGMKDFEGDFDAMEPAIAVVDSFRQKYGHTGDALGRFDWAHIYDTVERRIVWKNGAVVEAPKSETR